MNEQNKSFLAFSQCTLLNSTHGHRSDNDWSNHQQVEWNKLLLFAPENFKAAVHLLCGDDRPKSSNDATLQALRDKHPGPARRRPIDSTGNTCFTSLQVSPEDVKRALRTFLADSLGERDGLTPERFADLLA